MVIRAIVGVVLLAVGGIWIAQGTGAMKGSAMTGHSQYIVLGVIVALLGLLLLVWSWRVRGRRHPS